MPEDPKLPIDLDIPDDPEELKPIKVPAKDDPKKGHKRFNPGDMSGSSPEEPVVEPGEAGGTVPPKLAGERAKALMVMGRVGGFIEKYSNFAIDKFGGYKAGTIPSEKGGGKGRGTYTQMMSKDKALELLNNIPMMSTDNMMGAVKALYNYIWKIHGGMREKIRDEVAKRMVGQSGAIPKTGFDPSGRRYTPAELDAMRAQLKPDKDSLAYKDAIEAASKQFEIDSTQVKGDLNLLVAASGLLKRSGGFGSKADQAFLFKVRRGYVDDKTGKWIPKRNEFGEPIVQIMPQASAVALPPEMSKIAGLEAPSRSAASKSGTAPMRKVPPQAPIVRKGGASLGSEKLPMTLPADWWPKKKESIDRVFDRIIEAVCGESSPNWWDDL